MLEKGRSESDNFSYTKHDIQKYIYTIEIEGKGYALKLEGPDENARFDNYAMLFFDYSKGGKILIPVTTEKKTKAEIFNMVRDLKSPEKIDFSLAGEVDVNEKSRNQLMLGCVFSHIPVAMIAFGQSEKTKQRLATFYIIGNNSPQEMYKTIWDTADSVVEENNPEIIPPSEGEFN